MSFVVKWGRERLHFPLPPPTAKLGALRRVISEYTHLPEHAFKLIHSGAVMKDDNAPISAYSIRENSVVQVIPSAPLPSAPRSSSPYSSSSRSYHPYASAKSKHIHEPKTEQSTISQIRSEVDKVRQTLRPSVEAFLHSISVSPGSSATPTATEEVAGATSTFDAPAPAPGSTPAPAAYTQNQNYNQTQIRSQDTAPSQPTPLPSSLPPTATQSHTPEQEHTRLSELLLQSLLRLDAISTDGAWEHARAERKGAVKEVQGLLDRLDGGWGRRGRA